MPRLMFGSRLLTICMHRLFSSGHALIYWMPTQPTSHFAESTLEAKVSYIFVSHWVSVAFKTFKGLKEGPPNIRPRPIKAAPTNDF